MASNTDFDILTNRMANLNILEFFDSNRGGKLMKYKNYVYKKVKVKYIDGFYQMVSVHILKNGKNLPLCYAFLPRKTEAVYDAFFAWLDLSIENKPLSFSIDFEMAIMNTEHLLTRLNTGSVEHRRKKKFDELDERITNIINEYSNEKIEEFFINLSLLIAL